MHSSSFLFSALAVLAAACTSAPHEIRVDSTSLSLYTKASNALHARAVDKEGKAVDDVTLAYTPVSPDVVSVDSQGNAHCHKSGDAAVVVAGAGMNTTVRFTCKLATTIVVPPAQRLVIGEASHPIKASVLDENGGLIDNAPTVFTSSDAAVARVDDLKLVAQNVGNAIITASLGESKAEFAVEVVEVVQREALALGDGATQVLTLAPGSYEVDIVAVAGGGYGVTAQWVGARCPAAKEAQRHQMRCAFSEPASLRIENPTLLGMGDLAAGHLTVYRVAAL